MTTPAAPPVQFIANLHHAASCLANNDPNAASTYLARASDMAPTLELFKIVGNAMLEAQLGIPDKAEIHIAMALGMVEIRPVNGDLGEGWVEDEIPEAVISAAQVVEQHFKTQNIDRWRLCGLCSRNYATDHPKLQADRDRLLQALKQMVSLHAGQEHLYGLTASGEALYRAADEQARAAIKECEGRV